MVRDIAPLCFADLVVGASFGAIAVSGGLPAWVPIVMSLLVFAGGAQFAALGVVLAGGSPFSAVLTGLVLNARLLPFGFAVAEVLGGRWRGRLAGAHLMVDESVAFALRESDPGRRRRVYWLCGAALFVSWNAAVVLGALAGGALGDTDTFGLDAAFPAVLLALTLPSLAQGGTRGAAFVGAAVAVAATPFLPAGLPVLLALVGLVVAVRAPAAGPVPEPVTADGPDAAAGPAATDTADVSAVAATDSLGETR